MRNPIQRKSPSVFPYRGKFRIQYLDLDGRTRTKTAETKLEAFRELAKLESQMQLGFGSKPSKEIPYLGDWLEVWLSHREREVRLTTYLGFEAILRNYLKPLLGQLKLDRVTVFEIEAAYSVLREDKGLSPATVKKLHSILSQAFGMALRYGLVSRNPMVSVKAPVVHVEPKETLSFAEVRKVLDTAKGYEDDTYPRFLLALRLGMRQGECLALTWGDVDLEEAQIRVSKSVDVLPGRGAVVTPPKSRNSNRVIPLDDETLLALIQFQQRQGFLGSEELLFPALKGTHRNARTDYDNWKRLLVVAGVRSVRLHDARHAAATLLLAAGADARSIQLLLGHSSPGFTLATYVHPDQEALRRALERASGVSVGVIQSNTAQTSS